MRLQQNWHLFHLIIKMFYRLLIITLLVVLATSDKIQANQRNITEPSIAHDAKVQEKNEIKRQEIQVPSNNKPTAVKGPTSEQTPITIIEIAQTKTQKEKTKLLKSEELKQKEQNDGGSKLNASTTQKTEKQSVAKPKQAQNNKKAMQVKDNSQEKTPSVEVTQKTQQKPKELAEHSQQTIKKQKQASETEEESEEKQKQGKHQLKSQKENAKTEPTKPIVKVDASTKVEVVPVTEPTEPKKETVLKQSQLQQISEKQQISVHEISQIKPKEEDIQVKIHQIERQQINQPQSLSGIEKDFILRTQTTNKLNLRTEQKDVQLKLITSQEQAAHNKQAKLQQKQTLDAIVDSDPQLPKQQIMDSQTIIVLIILTFIISIPVVREIRSKGGETPIKRRQADAPAAVTKTISQSRIDEDYSEIDNGTGLQIGDRLDQEQA